MRSSVRVRPLSTEPIRSVFQGKPIVAIDIGAAGMSFQNQGFQPGKSEQITFSLPTEDRGVTVTTEISDIDSKGICHCLFVGISEEDINAIHRYMLAVQVHEVRKKRQVSPEPPRSKRPTSPAKSKRKATYDQSVYSEPQPSSLQCK